MDAQQFDRLAKQLSTPGTRRGLVCLMATMTLSSGLAILVWERSAIGGPRGQRRHNGDGHPNGHGNGRHRKR